MAYTLACTHIYIYIYSILHRHSVRARRGWKVRSLIIHDSLRSIIHTHTLKKICLYTGPLIIELYAARGSSGKQCASTPYMRAFASSHTLTSTRAQRTYTVAHKYARVYVYARRINRARINECLSDFVYARLYMCMCTCNQRQIV